MIRKCEGILALDQAKFQDVDYAGRTCGATSEQSLG